MRFSKVLILFSVLAGTAFGQSLEDISEAAEAIYGDGARLSALEIACSEADAKALNGLNDGAHPWKKVDAYTVSAGETRRGVVFVDNVKGKSRPITYMVAFDTAGTVLGLEILKYRESHGGEVRSPMFRDQFAGKKHADAIAVGKDIRNISGATISSRSVTRGTRALVTFMHYLKRENRL